MKTRFGNPFSTVYEGENEQTDEEKRAEEAKRIEEEKKKKVKIVFTPEQQELVNAQLAEERRKGKEKNDQLIAQLETQRQRADTTDAEKRSIETRIDQLRGEYATKEEQAKKTMEEQLKVERTKREAAEKSAKEWQDLYTTERIDGDLTSAAIEHKAFNPEPVKAVLRPQTRLVQELDTEGKPTGRYTTRIKIMKPPAQGQDKPQILEMTPSEAVKHLTEQPEKYGNLFISGAAGGIGGNNFNTRQTTDDKNGLPPEDTAEYMAQRRKERSRK